MAEAAELSLVGKVELKILLADTDAKLGSILKIYLAPLLLKLSSGHASVRQKVSSICAHVMTRLKSSPVELPTKALLDQFKTVKAEHDSALLRTFNLAFLQMAIERSAKDVQCALLPDLLTGIAQYERRYQKSLFQIVLRVLPAWQPPARGTTDAEAVRTRFAERSPADTAFLVDQFTAVMVLSLAMFSRAAAPVDVGDAEAAPPPMCPGLTADQVDFLTSGSKDTFTSAQLTQIKLAIYRFMDVTFAERDQFWPLLAGSQDAVTEVSDRGESAFKKLPTELEADAVVGRLYKYYIGVRAADGTFVQPPVAAKFRCKILQLLTRSKTAANKMPQLIEAITAGMKSDYGRERLATIEFVHWTVKMASDDVLRPIASQMVHNVRTWIVDSGWPVARNVTSQGRALRGFAYEAIGSLVKRCPEDLLKDTSVLEFLFASLKGEHADLRNSVNEAVLRIVPVLQMLSTDARENLKGLLLDQMLLGNEYPNSQQMALRFCIGAFPFSDPLARYICLLGLKPDNKPDVIDESRKGLHPYWYRRNHHLDNLFASAEDFDKPEYQPPAFAAMLSFVAHQQSMVADGEYRIGDSTTMYFAATKFLQRLLFAEALTGTNAVAVDEYWEEKLDEAVAVDCAAQAAVRDYLRTFWATDDSLRSFVDLTALALPSGQPDLVPVGRVWLDLLVLGPPELTLYSAKYKNALVGLCSSTNTEVRSLAAHAVAIILSSDHFDDATVAQACRASAETIAADTPLSSSFKAHGAVVALAYLLARLNLRGRLHVVDDAFVAAYFGQVLKFLEDDNNKLLQLGAIVAVGQLGSHFVLASVEAEELAKAAAALIKLTKRDSSEKALLAFAAVSLAQPVEARLKAADSLYELHEVKQTEFLFSVGEALSWVASGWSSLVLQRTKDIDSVPQSWRDAGSDVIEAVTEKVLAFSKTTKPALKRASCIWILSLLQYCGDSPSISGRLKQFHMAFLSYLGNRDELVQESASRGLSLVYEKGDSRLKDDLVSNLVQSFTSDTRSAATGGHISEDTQVFDSGVMSTGDGSVSTYKDIMNLASEVGDPSLIYKFMPLISSSAIWSTRKGAAFGLSSILSKVSLDDIVQSNPKLAKSLVPKLYRYKYDPNTTVQQSMKSIWDALVSDSSDILDQHFAEIMEELLGSIGNREWRVREASCAALQDLLDRSRSAQYKPYLERVWTMSFRALDDIKESVRKQGLALCKSLSNSLVRSVDADNSYTNKSAEETLTRLLPFLLGNSGLQSTAEEVQAFSLDTLLKLVKRGGPAMRPFVPQLVEELIDLLSTLEPQAVNYIALNADKYGLTGNDIDASRLASVRNSPISDALDNCIDLLREDNIEAVVRRLKHVIRKSVGLPSKVGSSRFLVNMIIRHYTMVSPYCDTLLKSLQSQLTDRNDTVVLSYATAAGYLCRYGSTDQVLALVKMAQTMYFEDGNERPRQIAGWVVSAICKNSPDRFTELAASILPFVFVAKHDAEKPIAESFEFVWNDSTGGTGSIKLYLPEITALARARLESQLWLVRQTVANSLATASNSIGGSIPDAQLASFFSVLIEAAKGRSWKGKEKILDALVGLAVNSEAYVLGDAALLEQLRKITVVEAKRNNLEYKIPAIESLAKFLHKFAREDSFDVVLEIMQPLLGDADDDSDESGAEDKDKDKFKAKKKKDQREKNQLLLLSALVEACATKYMTTDSLSKCLGELNRKLSEPDVGWNTKIAVCTGLDRLTDKLAEIAKANAADEPASRELVAKSAAVIDTLWPTVFQQCCADYSYENVRIQGVKTGAALLKLYKDVDSTAHAAVATALQERQKAEKSPVVLRAIQEALA
ncbi:proteasome stabiliser-domain-containing protein [Dipodascopsis tothii]|uniref:proteasome stabiliser-domain-containing protein n=1 Tax=Dipodascopsis tothii TaxID=44089 RepID=UPI0034CDC5C4